MSEEMKQPNEEIETQVENQQDADEVVINVEAEDVTSESQTSVEEVSVDELAAELQATKEALEKAREGHLRAEAEMQNLRRRVEKDIASAHKFALEKFVGELLPVADNIERGLEAARQNNDNVDALIEGMEMNQQVFLNVLTKFNVEELNPLNEPFNPELHQAMSMVENAELPANTVMAVMQKGYSLNGRLVRPAMVMVSKGGSSAIDEQA